MWIKPPVSASWEEWEKIHNNNKKNYPIRYFFSEFPWYKYQLYEFLKIIKYWFYHRFHPKHRHHMINTNLAYGYYDIPELFLHSCFTLLNRFVDDEDGLNPVIYQFPLSPDCFLDTVEDLYFWWNNIFPEYEKQQSELSSQYSETAMNDNQTEEDKTNDRRITRALYELEKLQLSIISWQLRRLISIREWLWT